MKKAQAEYIGIVLLILMVMMFALFNKLGSHRTQVQTAAEVVQQYRALSLTKAANTFPYISAGDGIPDKRIPLAEIMGDYVCYSKPPPLDIIKDPIYDVRYPLPIMPYELQVALNDAFGEDQWALVISEDRGGGLPWYPQRLYITSNTLSFVHADYIPLTGDYMTYEFALPLPCEFIYPPYDRLFFGLLFVKK